MTSIAFLLDAAAKATVLLGAAWLLTLAMHVMHRGSAAAHYFTWTCALGAVLAVPALMPILSRWDVHVKTPAMASAARGGLIADAALESTPAEAQSARAEPVIAWPVMIWLAGLAIMLARVAVGHLRLGLSLRGAREVRAPEWIAARDAAAGRIGLRRAIKLRRSGETDVPLTGGVFAAFVVLPETAEDWDAERRSIVLLHELTHARRSDPLLWLMAQVAVAFYWFHPLAWLAAARFRREQERSCDDAVVRAGAEQAAYAEHLVDLARSATNARAYAAALGMAAASDQTSDLEQRVRALLDARRKRNGMSRRACWTAVAAVLAAVIPLAALHGQESTPAASLVGTVYDASGAVAPGVLILLKNNSSHEEAARTNAAGEYKFSGLPAGSYALEIGAPGFAEFRKAIVLPAAAQTNITLGIGTVTEQVEVVGKAPRPPVATAPRRIRVGGNLQATRLIKMTKPVYPAGAEAAGIEGTVMLRAVISTSGDLLGTAVMNEWIDGELAGAAMDAVKQWHYQPTLLNGVPVEVVTTIAVTFRLER
jgi:TonB family protein